MQPSNTTTDYDCAICGFTFPGRKVQIIDGQTYCHDDARFVQRPTSPEAMAALRASLLAD